ncbi:MAG: methyltransferase domain-containing protein [Nitrospiraceae bacterium]|nr:methyltransferase domain-containing protein [Nitrospiraceae bacterium]
MSPSDGRHATGDVGGHYARLAPDYARKANRACQRAYRELVSRTLGGTRRILELGAGSSDAVAGLDAARVVACDLSLPMLRARTRLSSLPLVGDAQRVPCRDAAFDAVFCINLLEHVPEPGQAVAETARVLGKGGRFLAVTPNGNVAGLLELLERLHLKLPEGPHHFLTSEALAGLAEPHFRIVEHRRFLAFPAGPAAFVRGIDRIVGGKRSRGLFQYILMEKQ